MNNPENALAKLWAALPNDMNDSFDESKTMTEGEIQEMVAPFFAWKVNGASEEEPPAVDSVVWKLPE